jgi:metallo-beta-lactamase class B
MADFWETAPQIERNIAQLGFKLTDVKILLNSHAHLDHADGLAELKKLRGAKFLGIEGDAELLPSSGNPNAAGEPFRRSFSGRL